MNKTVFYAVKAWVSKLISGVERHIKAVEKDVQKINKKLPNFLTRNYTTDKSINLVSQDIGHLAYSEWQLNEIQEPWEPTRLWPESATIICELFTEPVFLYDISEHETPNIDGFYLMFSGGALIFYSSAVFVYGEAEIPVGWSLYHYDEAAGAFVATPFTTPPTIRLEGDQDSDIYNSLDYHATLVEEKWGEYVDYEAELYTNGRGIFLESTRGEDGEQSQIGVGPWGVRMSAYGNTLLEFGNNGNRVTGLDEPQDDTDAANKAYVDGKLTLNNGTIYQNGVDVTAQVKAALGIS